MKNTLVKQQLVFKSFFFPGNHIYSFVCLYILVHFSMCLMYASCNYFIFSILFICFFIYFIVHSSYSYFIAAHESQQWKCKRKRRIRTWERLWVFFFFWLGIHKLAYRLQPKRAHLDTQYWENPKVARLEGTPAIHVTCLYVSWYVRVVDTHLILKWSQDGFLAKIERYYQEIFFRKRNFGRSITCLQLCSH